MLCWLGYASGTIHSKSTQKSPSKLTRFYDKLHIQKFCKFNQQACNVVFAPTVEWMVHTT